MGYIKHHAIVVTGDVDYINLAHEEAKKIFDNHFSKEKTYESDSSDVVSNVMRGVANDTRSFFIAPDGSKEGWSMSDVGNDAREDFINWLRKYGKCDYVEVMFGGDDHYENIVNSSSK